MVRRKISEKDIRKIVREALKDAMLEQVDRAIKAADDNSALEDMASTTEQKDITRDVLTGQMPLDEAIERIVHDAKTR